MYKISALAAVALALSACQALPPVQSTRQTLRIATWNIEHLAERDGTGCRPRTEADYEDLRRHASTIGADVVALQEVENAEAAARVFPSDRWTIVMSERPTSSRGGFCRSGSTQKILKQDVGFAIRKGIPFKRNNDLRALGLGNPDLRWGVDVTIKGRRPIRLLSVHLKSGCHSGIDQTDRDCPILFAQAPVLESWIDERARAGEDFAVLGDWNRRTALPGDAFLSIVSDDDPSGGRLQFVNEGRKAACKARYPDYIDHIAIGQNTAKRVVPGTFTEYTYGSSEDLHPSDHCPSMVDLAD